MSDYRPYDYSAPLYTMAFCAVVAVGLQMFTIARVEWELASIKQKMREAEQQMQKVLRGHR